MRKIISLVAVGVLSLIASSAFAATINGTLNLTGAYAATGGSSGLSDATVVDLSGGTVFGAGATDDFATTISGATFGSGSSATISPFAPVDNFLTVGGWQLDLSSLNIVDQNGDLLTMNGTGVVSGNGFDETNATWSFSGESSTNYSMTVTAVPIPAAAWLFASSLCALVGVARRRA